MRQIIKPSAFLFACLFFLQAAYAHAEQTVDILAPKAEQFMLENGLQVVVIPDHRAPVVTHMVWYRVGAADDQPGKSGLAHFLEHLMFKGTKKNPSGRFVKWVSEVGGQQNAFTNYDHTAYFQRATKNYLPQLMEFEADRMTGLVLSDENVLPEREVIMEERRMRIEQHPEVLLDEAAQAALYQNHPYARPIIGWMHEMQQLSTQDVLDYYHRHYAPNNAILIVAGDVNTDEVRKLARDTYGKIAAVPGLPPRHRPIEPLARAARSVTYADARVEQVIWSRGYLTPSYSGPVKGAAPALDILEGILGGNTGRIYQRLVVEQKIAAMATADYDAFGLDSGSFAISVTPNSAADVPTIEKEVDAIIEDIVKNGVKAEEFERAKVSLIAKTIYAMDSQTYLARFFGVGLTSGMSFDEIREVPRMIAAVKPDDVREAARAWLIKERSVTGYLTKAEAKSQ